MDSKKQCKPVTLNYQLHVPDSHDPKLAPIILLHGTGATISTWSRVNLIIGNKTKRKVYSVDLRNHGESDWSEHNTLHHYEADLENFLQENDIKKCILIGHSLGGKIAMFFALRKPHLVEKIITEEVELSNPDMKSNDMKNMLQILESAKKIKMFPKGLKEKDIRELLIRLIAEKYPNNRDLLFCTPLKKNLDGSFEFFFNIDVIERAFKDGTAFLIDFNECQPFKGPALIMYGEGSFAKVYQDEKITDFFPNAKLSKSESCTHVLHVDRPDEFITTVSDFINM